MKTKSKRFAIATAAGLLLSLSTLPEASATLLGSSALSSASTTADSSITQIVFVRRGAVVRRRTVVGPRGGVASRTVVRRGAVVRPGFAGGGVRWARPGWYRWPRGGAIAAGAAIGFVTAASAVAWAGAAPAPGMCWYYTDPAQTKGFWDYCP